MIHLNLFSELSILLVVAALISMLMRYLKQPLIIGHIFTGLLVGPLVFGVFKSTETTSLFSEIGIAILLFTVGLNISPKVIKDFGKVSLATGLGEVILATVLGGLICLGLGYNFVSSLYIGVALSFSSTIIVLKLLTDKGDMDTLYAKVAIGFLLVQDILAILLLFMVPLFSSGQNSGIDIFLKLLIGFTLVTVIVIGSSNFLPKMNNFLSHSEELLLLFAIGWGIGIASLFKMAGFSLESGALIAGIALSSLPSRFEINSRLSPLRDFFIILFFISLGAQMVLTGFWSILLTALILSAFVMIGNTLIVVAIMGFMGYRKKTSLQMGLAISQISEFSLIFIALGVKIGDLNESVLSLVTLVGLITIFGCTYLITYSEQIYRATSKFLNLFERTNAHERYVKAHSYPMILFGSGRLGYDFLELFENQKKTFLVIDHNPDVIDELEQRKISAEFGDASDLDFLESLNFKAVKLMVSTIPKIDANILIADAIRRQNVDFDDIVMIAIAHNVEDALILYKEGYDYVIMPHHLGGSFAAEIIQKTRISKKRFSPLREKHLDYLEKRRKS
jgi:Kef-type K+ transport system membrane component KefB